LLGTFTSGLPL